MKQDVMKQKTLPNWLKYILVGTGICGVIAAMFALWGKGDYSSVLQANWDISLPSAAKCDQIYAKDSGASFHGDGVRFHVFTYGLIP